MMQELQTGTTLYHAFAKFGKHLSASLPHDLLPIELATIHRTELWESYGARMFVCVSGDTMIDSTAPYYVDFPDDETMVRFIFDWS